METKTPNLSEADLKNIERFKTGFPWMKIAAPATASRGIKVLSDEDADKAVEFYRSCPDVKTAKFVPASGAASRMFKDLFNKNVTVVNKFVSNIEKFAFYEPSLYAEHQGDDAVDFTLGEEGLGYGSKPKGVLKFHRYGTPGAKNAEVRTAIAEHMVEAAEYMRTKDGVCHLVVTISPEHEQLFRAEVEALRPVYEERYGVKYDIAFTYQYKWTDTIAVDAQNAPFLLEDGTPLHRPGGHGALINNLGEVDADLVSIKNIDNVSVQRYLPITAKWKMVLLGTALQLRERIFGYIKALRSNPTADLCAEVVSFLDKQLCIALPGGADAGKLLEILQRPIRVCGMVKNEGEPGGGPFIIEEKDGSTSLQILEGAQINPDDPKAVACLKAATHFNPVDLVCVLKDVDGQPFRLVDYVDPDAGFISGKSYQGRELKAMELPGLWNGAMSRWNTLFVQVPIETFNPVKTVMDLLRDAHQGAER